MRRIEQKVNNRQHLVFYIMCLLWLSRLLVGYCLFNTVISVSVVCVVSPSLSCLYSLRLPLHLPLYFRLCFSIHTSMPLDGISFNISLLSYWFGIFIISFCFNSVVVSVVAVVSIYRLISLSHLHILMPMFLYAAGWHHLLLTLLILIGHEYILYIMICFYSLLLLPFLLS